MRPRKKEEEGICFVLRGHYVELRMGDHKVLLTLSVAPSVLKGKGWSRHSDQATPLPHEFCGGSCSLKSPGSMCVGGWTHILLHVSPLRVPQASGILKGFDPLLNVVLDGTIEYMRGKLAKVVTGTMLGPCGSDCTRW